MPTTVSNSLAEYKDEYNYIDMDDELERLIEDTLIEMELSPDEVEEGIIRFFEGNSDDEDATLSEEERKEKAIKKIAGSLLDGYDGPESVDMDEACALVSHETVDKVLLELMCSPEFGAALVNLDIQDEDFAIGNVVPAKGIEERQFENGDLDKSSGKGAEPAKIDSDDEDSSKHRPVTRSMTRQWPLRK